MADLFVVIIHGPPNIQIDEMENIISKSLRKTPWEKLDFSVQRIDFLE